MGCTTDFDASLLREPLLVLRGEASPFGEPLLELGLLEESLVKTERFSFFMP